MQFKINFHAHPAKNGEESKKKYVKIPRLISSPCFPSSSLLSESESIICGFPNHIQQTGIHLVVFRKHNSSVLCFFFSLSRDLQAKAETAEKNDYNIRNNNKTAKRPAIMSKRSKDFPPTSTDRWSRDAFLINYGNFMRVGIVNGQINFL